MFRRTPVVIALVLIALGRLLPAQGPEPLGLPAPRGGGRALCRCGVPSYPWHQQPDGRWRDRDEGSDVRVTALATLGLLADGSRFGGVQADDEFVVHVERGVHWLQDEQDGRGRIGFADRPDWFLDHLLAACAVAQAARTCPGARELLPTVDAAVGAAVVECAGRARVGVDAETALWAELLGRTVVAIAPAWDLPPPRHVAGLADAGSVLVATARPVRTVGGGPRAQAAQWLRAAMSGELPAALRCEDPERALGGEPMAAFYALAAVQGDRLARRRWTTSPMHRLVQERTEDRVGLAARRLLAATLYYRYCHLWLWDWTD